jgi:hypothetical protein
LDRGDAWPLINYYATTHPVEVPGFPPEIVDRPASFNDPGIIEHQLPGSKAIVEPMNIDEHEK